MTKPEPLTNEKMKQVLEGKDDWQVLFHESDVRSAYLWAVKELGVEEENYRNTFYLRRLRVLKILKEAFEAVSG